MVVGIRKWAFPLALPIALFPLQRAFAAGPACHTLGTTGMAFGNYDPITVTALDSQASITYNCPPPIPPISVSISQGGSNSFFPRSMAGPASDRLQYNLYVDGARTTVFGDGTGGTVTVVAPAGKGSITVFGRVFPNQDVSAGAYADTVIVTFNF